jgi:hypothetical protein
MEVCRQRPGTGQETKDEKNLWKNREKHEDPIQNGKMNSNADRNRPECRIFEEEKVCVSWHE